MFLATIAAATTLLLLSSAFNAAEAAPSVNWAPNLVNATVAPGQRAEIQVSFNAVEALGNVSLRVVPEIAPYVSVSPSTLNNVKAGDSFTIRITVQAAATAPLRLFEGTIQVRQMTTGPGNGRVFARPLPVHVLIREQEGIAGVDADNNGVWDYVDQYINTTYPNEPNTRVALRQFSRAIQNSLLHADDKSLSLRYAEDSDRATECVFFVHPQDADKVLSALEAAILNNATRSRAFMMFSEQSAGQVFQSAPISQRSASCIAE